MKSRSGGDPVCHISGNKTAESFPYTNTKTHISIISEPCLPCHCVNLL